MAALPLPARSVGTCQYPEARSNVEHHFAPERADKESSMHGSGYASLTVVAFTFAKWRLKFLGHFKDLMVLFKEFQSFAPL